MVHSGFWQILQATGSRFLTSSGHLVHASDAEQAAEILGRWKQDGIGKLAEPAWSLPIKEAVRARARARGVAEVQAARDADDGPGSLKVVNGLPSVISSTTSGDTGEAVEDFSLGDEMLRRVEEGGEEEGEEALTPPRAGFMARPELERFNTGGTMKDLGTVRVTERTRPAIEGLPGGGADEVDDLITHSFDDPLTASTSISLAPFTPSLTTIEKAVSTRIFFETHYHAILKQPRGRDQRQAALEKELARLNISDREKRNIRDAWTESETMYLRDVRKKVGVAQFSKVKVIGHGAFGVVSLVKEKGSGELYAMKQLRKADMLKKGQEGHVRAERDLLAAAATATQWTVRLAYSFQDVDHLYLVMQYMSGGDLLTLLIEKDIFEEDFARFYMAEMVLAVEETHKVLGAIHRDIKPDNFLFDASGHIAISDFGLATDFHWAHDGHYFEQQRLHLLRKHGIDVEDGHLAPATTKFDQEGSIGGIDDAPGSILTYRDRHRRKLAYSVVGTNNYMPVEVLRGNGYDESCDWWSLGVILFEMLYGYPPFVSKNRQQTRQKIMHWKQALRFPARPRVSREAQDLIASLICEKEDRLGSRSPASVSRPNSVITQRRSGFLNAGATAGGGAAGERSMLAGADEVKAHPWFRGIDFANIHRQTPPFVPDLADPADTRYFEDGIDDNPLPPPELAPGMPIPDETKDPMLRDKIHGPQILNVRKQLAFQGWTFKGQRNQVFDPRKGILRSKGTRPPVPDQGRGRSTIRTNSSLIRSLSV
ncbi:serine/threonine protein kinase Cbk1 [Pseudohyphozyma bogoriensis]|nr:serine/threonine protein kinase Cbk1 [Pseudohyphozyma bogoriensis]